MSADFRVKNGIIVTENATILEATDATSATDTSASIYTAGGVAVSKKLYVGTNLDVQGTSNLVGAVTLTGDLAVNGGDITTSSTTGTLFNSTATTVRIGEGATTAISIGSTGGTGTTTVNHALTVSRTLTASSTVSLSPVNANVTISPSGTGIVTIAPVGGGNINNMTIGATTPRPATFSNSGSFSARIRGVAGSASTESLFLTETSKGTLASPTQILNNDVLLSIAARGYTGSAFAGGAKIEFTATENITGSNQGTKISLFGVPAGGTATNELSWNGTVLTSSAAFTVGTAGTLVTLAGNLSATASNQTIVLSPTGTGTVAISPVGALTINPTAASTMNNVAIGGTTATTAKFTTLDASGQVQFTAGTAAGDGTGTVIVTGGAYLSGGLWAASSSTLAGLSSTSTTTLSPNNASVTISPTGTGTVTIAPATAGNINNMNIGASTRGTGAFTTLTTNGTVTITGGTSSTTPTSGQLQVTGGVGISENLNVGGALVVTGNLTVNGTTTTVNSTTITVDDKNIELGSVTSPDNTTADGGGITLKGATDKTFNWVNSTLAWTSSEHLDLASGKEYYINGTSVLNATTLGSGVTSSSLTSVGTLTSITTSGNLTFTGTGNRITGDFSNATIANRVMFQTTTPNSSTAVSAIPSGSGTTGAFQALNNSDPTNSAYCGIDCSTITNASNIRSDIRGTGTYLPMAFYTGGAERMRIDTSGNVGIGTSSPNAKLHVASTNNIISSTGTGGYGAFYAQGSSTNPAFIFLGNGSGENGRITSENGGALYFSNGNGSVTERMRIDSSGNVGIGTSSPSNALVVSRSGGTATYIQSVSGTNNSLFGHGAGGELVTGSFSNQPYLFFTNSTEKMRIDSSGNVGIGTSSLVSKLNVLGNVEFRGLENGTATAVVAFLKGLDGAQAGYWGYGNTTSPMEYVNNRNTGHVWYDGASERMRIDSSGNVGIGVGPAKSYSKLHILSPDNPVIVVEDSGNGVGYFSQLAASTNIGAETQITFSTGVNFSSGPASSGTERMRIDSSGNVGIGTLAPAAKLNIQGPGETGAPTVGGSKAASIYVGGTGAAGAGGSIEFGARSGTTFSAIKGSLANGTSNTVGDLIFYTRNAVTDAAMTERLRIDFSGNVGIGTSSFDFSSSGRGVLEINGSSESLIGFKAGNTAYGYIQTTTIAFNLVAASTILALTTNSALPILLQTNNAERMRIHASGGVSIGNTTDSGAASLNVSGSISGGYISHAAGTTAMAFGSDNVVRVTPNATATYTTTVPAAGAICVLSILTSGTTSYTITFGTGFKSTGTLATGTVSARYFNITFVSDGTNLIETARTVAIA